MNLRRHPSRPKLGAWFDGEDPTAEVGGHVARCAHCTRAVSEMARVRAWIRAQPFFAMETEGASSTMPPGQGPSLRRWRPRAVALALLIVLTMLLVNATRLRGPERSGGAGAPNALFNAGSEDQARSSAATQPDGQQNQDAEAQAASNAARDQGPLRLGLVVPAKGPAAAEGIDVVKAVRQRVDAANQSGGVGGLPVELVVAAAEDPGAVAALPKRVSALVGGFGAGAPSSVPWLFPADPWVGGPNVVAAQPSPEAAGQQFGELLRAQPLGGPVGVVVGAGPESSLAAGLGSRVPTVTVAAATDTPCVSEVASLRRDGAAALAVAGPPDLARRCLVAAARALWSPRFGSIVTPSAAYAGLDSVLQARGSRTMLGLPWPTFPAGGAARVRATAGTRSYRALVSFAAAELALDAARRKGAVSVASLAGGSWRSDLFEMAGTTVRPIPVAVGTAGWAPAPELGVAPILPPLLPVPVPGVSS